MKSIEILVKSVGIEQKIMIDCVKKQIIIDNRMDLIKQEKIEELLRIIRLWKNEYSGLNVVDGESFLIRINTGNMIEIIQGKGNYPDNYNDFKEWISVFYE